METWRFDGIDVVSPMVFDDRTHIFTNGVLAPCRTPSDSGRRPRLARGRTHRTVRDRHPAWALARTAGSPRTDCRARGPARFSGWCWAGNWGCNAGSAAAGWGAGTMVTGTSAPSTAAIEAESLATATRMHIPARHTTGKITFSVSNISRTNRDGAQSQAFAFRLWTASSQSTISAVGSSASAMRPASLYAIGASSRTPSTTDSE